MHRAHPWHGVSWRTDDDNAVLAYVEIVPTDSVKYELDKASGILRVDRPQKYSSLCPALYGLVPQTYCGSIVGEHTSRRIGRAVEGDKDPLDICILTERAISHGDILVSCVPLGGLRIIDGDHADDKIVAVLVGDAAYGGYTDIAEVPTAVIGRLEHYFLTYKEFPAHSPREVKLHGIYGAGEARQIIDLAAQDYANL
ncbi:MAG TPA: inorganic pyrophosphatase [Candidatus Xenobia bacterium]|jgi:inorganic pyrophosphatase